MGTHRSQGNNFNKILQQLFGARYSFGFRGEYRGSDNESTDPWCLFLPGILTAIVIGTNFQDYHGRKHDTSGR